MKNRRSLETIAIIQEAFVFGIAVMFFCALASIMLSGCSSFSTESFTGPKEGTVYMYDLKGTVNGTPFDGVGVIPYAPSYVLRIESKVDVDLMDISSCARNFHQESVITSGGLFSWFKPRRAYQYTFVPEEGIENYGSCLLRLGAYNKDKGQNAWGILDFETPDSSLPASTLCNGETAPPKMVTICQSKAGLVQRIIFDVPVKQDTNKLDPRCQMKSKDGKVWEYPLPAGECVIAFMEVGGEHRVHRHTTVSYTDYMIRGN